MNSGSDPVLPAIVNACDMESMEAVSIIGCPTLTQGNYSALEAKLETVSSVFLHAPLLLHMRPLVTEGHQSKRHRWSLIESGFARGAVC